MAKAKKSGSAAKRNVAGKYAVRTVKKIATAARAEIAKVEAQDKELRVSLGHMAITADLLRKQRRLLARVVSVLAEHVQADADGVRRLRLDALDAAPTVGFAIDGDGLLILPPLPASDGDADPGPVDRDCVSKFEAADVTAEAQIGAAAEASADAILALDDETGPGLGAQEHHVTAASTTCGYCSGPLTVPEGKPDHKGCLRCDWSAPVSG